MESFEWRIRKLETQLIGSTNNATLQCSDVEQESICDRLENIAKLYKNFLDVSGPEYKRFVELYEKHKNLLDHLDSASQISELAKAELVLAYEDDLVRHLESLQKTVERADSILNVENWPDLTGYNDRLSKLQTITRDQHLQAVKLDQRTEELIEVYNEIINSFKDNTVIWNRRLEAYENEEPKLDEDE